jgi:hypothetical protein
LISLAWKGNGQYIGNTADFSGIGVDATHYREYAIGYARDITDKIVIGGRLKYLQGLSNISTKRSTIKYSINGEDFAYTAQTDILVNCSLPEEVWDTSHNNNNSGFDVGKYLMNSQNKGYGIDLGGSYKLNDKFSFGASVLDLGYIHWKSGVKNYSSNVESFTFDGIDVSQFIGKNDSATTAYINHFTDSISDIFKIKETKNSYSTPLTTKVLLTGIYSLTPKDKVGLLVSSEFYKGIHPALTVSYNKMFFNMLSTSVSYSIINRSYMNLGFGMALNLGPFQSYILTDNFYCFLSPESTRNVNVHFGLNYIFGYKEKKVGESLYKDTPKEPKK